MNKTEIKEMLCKAVDNIPDCAEVVDCWTEHSYGSFDAAIHIKIAVTEKTEENRTTFHDVAHNAFDTDMDFIS